MRKSRFSEEQINKMLKEHAAGLLAGELCRKYGVSDAAFYKWRSRYGGMEISDACKLQAPADEDRGLKKSAGRDSAGRKHAAGDVWKKLERPGLLRNADSAIEEEACCWFARVASSTIRSSIGFTGRSV